MSLCLDWLRGGASRTLFEPGGYLADFIDNLTRNTEGTFDWAKSGRHETGRYCPLVAAPHP